MLTRPWQIWSAAGACLLLVSGALAWLTFKAIAADRADQTAQEQAAIEENVRLALWRMDTRLAGLLSDESMRPTYNYAAAIQLPAALAEQNNLNRQQQTKQQLSVDNTLLISPLIQPNTAEIRCYFQVDPAGVVTSPAVPSTALQNKLIPNYTNLACVSAAQDDLSRLRVLFSKHQLRTILAEKSRELNLDHPQQNRFVNLNNGLMNTSSVVMPESFDVQHGKNLANPTVPNVQLPPLVSNNTGTNSADSTSNQQIATNSISPSNKSSRYLAPVTEGNTRNPRSSIQNAQVNQAQSNDANESVQQEVALPPQQKQQWDRGVNEFGQRAAYVDNSTNNAGLFNNDDSNRELLTNAWAVNQAVNKNGKQLQPALRYSRMIPLWLDQELLLVRSVQVGDEQLLQGCWLDWPGMQTELKKLIADLLPQAELQPARTDSVEEPRLLAALPIQLVPGVIGSSSPPSWSPLRWSLVIAWSSLGIAALAIGLVGQGTISLSERRAAFVSAVTHELRTPLTTFRMYAEMLAEEMVPDEELRRSYCRTLHHEADRLSHLVENVLAYARLERGSSGNRQVTLPLEELLRTATERLSTRTAQADFELELNCDPTLAEAQITTDPGAVEQIIFNLVDNACKYAASATDRRIIITFTKESQQWLFSVRDFGPGITTTDAATLFQPFRKSAARAAVTAPGVGLGLALCRRLARAMNGELRYQGLASGAQFELSLPA